MIVDSPLTKTKAELNTVDQGIWETVYLFKIYYKTQHDVLFSHSKFFKVNKDF